MFSFISDDVVSVRFKSGLSIRLTLARASAKPVTRAMEKCARQVLRYVAGTTTEGLEYSPEHEADFNEKMRKAAGHKENDDAPGKDDRLAKPMHIFSDASFGVNYQSLKSISALSS